MTNTPPPPEKPLFELGQIVATPGALEEIPAPVIHASLFRHNTGDWGDLCAEDAAENDFALGKRLRIFSAYEYPDVPKFWIITEADRSATTILLPDEY